MSELGYHPIYWSMNDESDSRLCYGFCSVNYCISSAVATFVLQFK
jgi:hypothetical protein